MMYLYNVSNEFKKYLREEDVMYFEINQNYKQLKSEVVTEEEYISDGKLVSKIKVYLNGEIKHIIKNSIKVVETEDGVKIGGQYIHELNPYMLKMFHPRYKSYIEFKEYVKVIETKE